MTDLVGPSGFKINGGRVSGLPQGVFVGGDSLPKVEGRGDRFDPETEVRPAPGQPLAPAVGYPQHRVLEVFRIPFDGDAVAFRLVDEGDPRLLWACDENDLVDLDAEWNPREVDGRPIGARSSAEILEDSADLEDGGARVDEERPIGVALRGLDARRALVLGKSEDRVEAERQSAVLAHRDRVDELDGAFGAGHAPFNARDRGVPGVVEGEERGVIADLDGRPFEVRGWAVDPLGGARVAVALLFGAADALDPASQTWEFMPETRISDEASFQARWNDKRVVVRVRAEDADVQATDAVKLTTADGSFRIPRSGGAVDGRSGPGSRHVGCCSGTARARRIHRPRCGEAGCEGSGVPLAGLNALRFFYGRFCRS